MENKIITTIAAIFFFGPSAAYSDSITLTFDTNVGGTIQDVNGVGTGLTDRLPGTGDALPTQDPNILLNTGAGELTITSTSSDINGQINLPIGEYLGLNLSSLGYTGSEDFGVSATFEDIQYSQAFDQFGLYVGVDSDTNFRTGYLYFFDGFFEQLFSVHNTTGLDSALTLGAGPTAGSSIDISISRVGGIFDVGIGGNTFNIVQPSFLNVASDLNVGIFAANSRNDTPRNATVSRFSANVDTIVKVPEPGTLTLFGIGLFGLGLARRNAA